jgi:ribosomal protein S27AE
MNLIEHLDDFLTLKASDLIASKERSQMSENKYFQKLTQKITKLEEKPKDWLYEFEGCLPEELLTLTNEQKQDLITYLKDLGIEEFSGHMALLCKILSYFEQDNELETPLAQTILQNYTYLKAEVFPTFYPQEAVKFHNRLHKNKKITENKPKCPKCGSDQLISMGINWFCKTCKRQTKKHLI